MFKMDHETTGEDDEELQMGGEKIMMTCVGVGYTNLSKTMV